MLKNNKAKNFNAKFFKALLSKRKFRTYSSIFSGDGGFQNHKESMKTRASMMTMWEDKDHIGKDGPAFPRLNTY